MSTITSMSISLFLLCCLFVFWSGLLSGFWQRGKVVHYCHYVVRSVSFPGQWILLGPPLLKGLRRRLVPLHFLVFTPNPFLWKPYPTCYFIMTWMIHTLNMIMLTFLKGFYRLSYMIYAYACQIKRMYVNSLYLTYDCVAVVRSWGFPLSVCFGGNKRTRHRHQVLLPSAIIMADSRSPLSCWTSSASVLLSCFNSSSLSQWVHACDALELPAQQREQLDSFIDQLYKDIEKGQSFISVRQYFLQ